MNEAEKRDNMVTMTETEKELYKAFTKGMNVPPSLSGSLLILFYVETFMAAYLKRLEDDYNAANQDVSFRTALDSFGKSAEYNSAMDMTICLFKELSEFYKTCIAEDGIILGEKVSKRLSSFSSDALQYFISCRSEENDDNKE